MNVSLKKEFDFIVGIDFGANSSGCVYASTENLDTFYSVKEWPRTSTLDKKVPSMISYANTISVSPMIAHAKSQISEPRTVNQESKEESFLIDVENKILGMGHVHASPNPIIVKDLLGKLSLSPLVPDDNYRIPTVDFLRLFHDHIIQQIKKRHGENGSRRIRYCFTLQHSSIPIYEKNLATAIELAGIISVKNSEDKLMFIDTYLAIASHYSKRKNLKKNDTFIICNADAQSTNIRTIKVTDIKKGMHQHNLLAGITNEDWCSDRLDELFDQYIGTIITKHPLNTVDSFQETLSIAIEHFQVHMKFKLDLSIERLAYIDIHTSTEPAFYLTLNTKEIKQQVYKPIVDEIVKAAKQLYIQHSATSIFLCGILSQIPYLRQEFRKVTYNLQFATIDDLSAAHGAVYDALSRESLIKRIAPICTQEAGCILEDDVKTDVKRPEYTHIIGIDFGTSFSKWYYSTVDGNGQPDFDNDLMLVPTLSLYDEGLRKQRLWGKDAFDKYYQDGENGKLMTRLKLFLDYVDENDVVDIQVISAIANYLRSLHEKIKTSMELLSLGVSKNYRYCLTVPIIWSDKMKKIMRETAMSSGLISPEDEPSRLVLVSEPEAAAVFYASNPQANFIRSLFNEDRSRKKIRALICDAGGGTVDMATFDYLKPTSGQDFIMDEVTAGTGKLCGSSFLDDEFRKLIYTKCDQAKYTVSKYDIEQVVLDFILNIKEDYTYTYKEDITLGVPNQNGNSITITSNEMSNIVYHPIISQIIGLLQTQINLANDTNSKLDMIIITGGLGQSKYLLDRVRYLVRETDIRVHSPESYDQSVVRGAVETLIRPHCIRSRIVRHSYGMEVQLPAESTSETYDPKSQAPICTSLKYDNLFHAGKSMKTNEYVQKRYYIAYPNNAFISILSNEGQPTSIVSSTDSRLKMVIRTFIDIPSSIVLVEGDVVPILVRLYLGQTEIKLDIIVDVENAKSWSQVKEMRQEQKRIDEKRLASQAKDFKPADTSLTSVKTIPPKKSKAQKGLFKHFKWSTK